MGKTAVAVRKNTLPANWQAMMREDAKKGKAQVANLGGSQRLKTKGGMLTYMDAPCPGNKIECVVLAAAFENTYYAGEYDAANTAPPVCYAFGKAGEGDKGMAPHEEAADKQNADCDSCAHNKFGSAEKGRGKACKNGIHLALIHADSLKKKGGVDEAEVVTVSVPPTSLPGFKGYTKQLEQLGGELPPYAFITELSITPREAGGFFLNLVPLKRIDAKLMPDVFAKAKAAEKDVDARPPFPEKDEAAKPAKPNRTAQKIAGGKKGK